MSYTKELLIQACERLAIDPFNMWNNNGEIKTEVQIEYNHLVGKTKQQKKIKNET